MKAIAKALVLMFVLVNLNACASEDEKQAAEMDEKVLQPLVAAQQQGNQEEIVRQCTAFEMVLAAPSVKKHAYDKDGNGKLTLKTQGATAAMVKDLTTRCEGVDTGVKKRR